MLSIVLFAAAAWMFFLLKLDENRKYKKLLKEIIIFFLFGMLSVIPADILEGWASEFANFISISELSYYSINDLCVGLIEEASKLSVFFIVFIIRKPAREPKDIMILSASVALAFASLENIVYGIDGGREVVKMRSLITVLGHMTDASIWGFGLVLFYYADLPKETRKLMFFGSYFASAFVHGIYDFFLDIGLLSFSLIISVGCLFLTGSMLIFLIEKSPYKKFKLREAKEAIPILKRGLVFYKDSYIINRRLAVFYLYTGNYKKAAIHLTACSRQQKKDLYILFFLNAARYFINPDERFLKNIRVVVRHVKPSSIAALKREVRRILKDNSLREHLLIELSYHEPGHLLYGLHKMV
ncbi:MAG: PrsW family intramembrane metalloprotease [Spirochaetales bacterium]|nr:PrsW family intramembrane metalloprotease [Spirochaetales bacterium]